MSAAATFSAKLLGVPNWAFLPCRSALVTTRPTERHAHTRIGASASTTFSIISAGGGMLAGLSPLAMPPAHQT